MSAKKILIVIVVFVIALAGFAFYQSEKKGQKDNAKTEAKIEENQDMVVPTMQERIADNAIWCGTFQLLWNDLKKDLAKQDIVFNPQLQVVHHLNQGEFTTQDISQNAYYKKYGIPSLALKEEIEKGIQEKFGETSQILDDFNWESENADDYFLYAMLKKEFTFETEFQEWEKGTFGNQKEIAFFGITSSEKNQARNQVQVDYYHSAEDFGITLHTKEGEEILLSKSPQGSTLKEIYERRQKETQNYEGSRRLQTNELVKIPCIDFKQKQEFQEIENKPFSFADEKHYFITKALQTIELQLDKKGGAVKSEAGMGVMQTSLQKPEEKRQFFLDNTFAIFLKEKGKDIPYLAAKITDIKQFQK